MVVVPASLIVPLFNAKQSAPNDNTSSSFVAALAAPITNENTNSFVPVPEAYANACGPLPVPEPSFPLVAAKVGVQPVVTTATGSLNLTLADKVNPSDLSAVVVIHSISVISAAPSEADSPPSATKTS